MASGNTLSRFKEDSIRPSKHTDSEGLATTWEGNYLENILNSSVG